MEDPRGWNLAETETEEGGPLFVRIKQYEPGFPSAQYPHRLEVSWPASEGAEHGLPTQSDLADMEFFENHLCAALEADEQSSLSLVFTGAGERAWIFHSRDPQEFLQRLSNIPHGEEPYPIDIAHEMDEAWEVYTSYLPDGDA